MQGMSQRNQMTISMLVLTLLRKRVSYIVTGALNIFGMNDIDSQPTTHIYEGKIGDKEEMQKYLPDKAKSFVQSYALPDVPSLPTYGPQSNTLMCRYCNKMYKELH